MIIVLNLFEGGAMKCHDWIFIASETSVEELSFCAIPHSWKPFKGEEGPGMLQRLSNPSYVISYVDACKVLCQFSRISSGVELIFFL